jgi:hypothetical protein
MLGPAKRPSNADLAKRHDEPVLVPTAGEHERVTPLREA